MYDVIVTNPSWYPLNPWYSMVYSSFFYDIIVANPSWYPPNLWRNMVYSRFFIWYRTFSWWHHRFSWWHHRFSWWHSMLHTMLFHDQYHRYLMPCLCWKSARTPLYHGFGQSTALLHQSHLPHCQLACLAVQQWLFLLATCCREESGNNDSERLKVGVHSESPGPLAGASGPVSVLGYFNLRVRRCAASVILPVQNQRIKRN